MFCGFIGQGDGETPPVAYGDSPLWDGALGMAAKFPAKAQSARVRQRLPLRGSWQSRQALTEGVEPLRKEFGKNLSKSVDKRSGVWYYT